MRTHPASPSVEHGARLASVEVWKVSWFWPMTCGAHTLLGTVIRLFIPASVYTCTRTNLRVTYFGQSGGWSESTLILTNESQSKIAILCVDQSQASKLVTEDRQTGTDRDRRTGKWLIGLSAEPEPKRATCGPWTMAVFVRETCDKLN
jgi:hypothetical protein